jgi:hypothetical protein
MNHPILLRTLLAGAVALAAMAVPFPSRAADPIAACQKATAKALSTCLEKLARAELKCFDKTGAACPEDGKKEADALAGIEKRILKKCADAPAVAEAGYAPLAPAELVARFQTACAREVDDIAARAFGGPDGPLLAGASAPDAKCLLAAGKEAGKILVGTLDAAARCVGKACDAGDLDKTDDKQAALEEKAAGRIDKKCGDLAGLVGLDTEAFVREAAARAADATASPCDPLDDDYCLFPFPNDYFTVGDATSRTGRRLAFTSEALPANAAAGRHVDPAKWNVVDGFSVGPMLLFLEETIDLAMTGAPPITDIAASLEPDAPVLLLDAETGAQQLLFAERDVRADVPATSSTIVRPGANLLNGHRYLAAMRSLQDGAGAALAADPVFAAYRDRTATPQLPVEARRPHMEALFAELAAFGVARGDLTLAWDFTTQSTESSSENLLHMRDDAFAILGDGAPAFTVDHVDEPLDANVFRRIDGTFQVPNYLTSTDTVPAELRLGPGGLPENQGDFFTAHYRCLIPHSATSGDMAPAVPGRPVLYGHGLLGSHEETSAGNVRAFAQEHDLIICGTDWTGFAEEDQLVALLALQNFSNFPKFIERQHQGILNFMVLGRLLLQEEEGFASNAAFQVDGQSVIDPSGLFYDGNSQGGILGGVLAAFSQDILRFVLGVPGINYSTLLHRSKDFAPFNEILLESYPDAVDRIALLALAQILWDRTDPSGHVRHTMADTYPDTPPKKILYQVAFGDQQVAPFTVEVAARSNGARIHTPVLEPGKMVPEVEPYYGILPIESYPYDGSAVVIWDSGNPPPPIVNLAPPEILPSDPEWDDLTPCPQDHDSDPHECPRRQPAARLQKSEFLKNDGAVVDVCGGMACLAPMP